jgi:hypothetical protein
VVDLLIVSYLGPKYHMLALPVLKNTKVLKCADYVVGMDGGLLANVLKNHFKKLVKTQQDCKQD